MHSFVNGRKKADIHTVNFQRRRFDTSEMVNKYAVRNKPTGRHDPGEAGGAHAHGISLFSRAADHFHDAVFFSGVPEGPGLLRLADRAAHGH